MSLTKLSSQASTPKGGAARSTVRILYVEDEDQNWEVAQLLLRDKYELRRAKDAREFFDLVAKHSFDCILMDIQLAGSEFNGIEITKILKGLYKGVVPAYAKVDKTNSVGVIFVTAYNARYSREELLAAGGDEMIPKPVDFTRLSLAISRLIMKRMSIK